MVVAEEEEAGRADGGDGCDERGAGEAMFLSGRNAAGGMFYMSRVVFQRGRIAVHDGLCVDGGVNGTMYSRVRKAAL